MSRRQHCRLDDAVVEERRSPSWAISPTIIFESIRGKLASPDGVLETIPIATASAGICWTISLGGRSGCRLGSDESEPVAFEVESRNSTVTS